MSLAAFSEAREIHEKNKNFHCFDALLPAFTNSAHEKNIFLYQGLYSTRPRLDLLNQVTKFSPTLKSNEKLFLYNLFNTKKKNNFAHL